VPLQSDADGQPLVKTVATARLIRTPFKSCSIFQLTHFPRSAQDSL